MAFTYDSVHLPQPRDQIRLLHIQPASDDLDIQARLEVYSLNHCPPFRAISYTWGDQKPAISISINGRSCQVRMNCWYALWQMRHHKHPGPLWVDSICIDQSNFDEKSAQVSLMGRIYSKAESTACCLGPGRNLANVERLLRPASDNDTSSTLAAEKHLLRELQHRPYFRRTWIKQEIILSRQIHLFCGMDRIDWDTYVKVLENSINHDLRSLTRALDQHPGSSGLADDIHMKLVEGRRSRRSRIQLSPDIALLGSDESPSKPWVELWGLLMQYGDSECEDARDKVYALLALLPEQSRIELDLAIDYALPVLHLCLKVIEGYLDICSTATEPQPTLSEVPDMFWDAMTNMIEFWMHTSLSDAAVLNYISRWTTSDEQSLAKTAQCGRSVGFTRSPRFIHLDVWQRFQIVGRVSDLFQEDLWCRDTFTENEPSMSDPKCFPSLISDAVTVDEIREFWRRTAGVDRKPELDACTSRSGAFDFSALASDLRVKVLISKSAKRVLRFLVPVDTAIEDELLLCPSASPREMTFFYPIVRRFKDSCQHSSSTGDVTVQSYLNGWAIQLLLDGTLRTQPHVEQKNVHPIAEFKELYRQPRLHLFLNYEDLILDTILRQDAASYLTHPRTHPEEPSFFEEAFHDQYDSRPQHLNRYILDFKMNSHRTLIDAGYYRRSPGT